MNQYEPPRIQQERRAIQVGKEATGRKTKPAKSEIEERRGEPVAKLAAEYGVSTQTIRNWRNDEGVEKPIYFGNGIKTTIPHMGRPSYWNQCIMTEYSKELKGFPDWSFFWNEEVRKKKTRTRWHALPKEVRKLKNSRKPKDPFLRRQKLNDAERRRNAENPHYRTMNSLRARFAKFFKGGKSRSVRRLIGCTIEEFKTHIESKFSKKMTWDNYGSYWHIDHMLPCSSFDHTNEDHVAACWHWTNMQPLEAKKNLAKSNQFTNPQMSLRIDFAA